MRGELKQFQRHFRPPTPLPQLPISRPSTAWPQSQNLHLVHFDRRGKRRKQIRLWSKILLRQTTGRRHAKLRDIEALWQRDEVPQPSEYGHEELRMQVIEKLLGWVLPGVRVDAVNGIELTKQMLVERIEPHLKNAAVRQTIRAVLGSGPSETTAENPMQWVIGFLKRLGIKAKGYGKTHRRYVLGHDPSFSKPELRRQAIAYHETRQVQLHGHVVEKCTLPVGTDVEAILATLLEAA